MLDENAFLLNYQSGAVEELRVLEEGMGKVVEKRKGIF